MRRTTYGVLAVAVLAVVAHLALGGLLFAVPGPWKHWALGALVAGVVLHLVVRHRHKSRSRPVSSADSPRSGGTYEH